MDLQTNYVDFGLQIALSVIVMSVLLFVDLSDHSTYIFLGIIPLLFGYTAFISKEGYNRSSLASAIVLVYAPISSFMFITGFLIFLMNNLISLFSNTSKFKDYYSSTALPLLITGLILGILLAGYSSVDQGFQSGLEDDIIDVAANSTIDSINAAGLGQTDQVERVESLVNSSVTSTESYVTRNYMENAEDPQIDALQQSFEGAEDEAISQLEIRQNPDQVIETQVRQMLESMIKGKLSILAIPFTILFLYTLQPMIGLLTAIYAKSLSSVYNVVNS